MERRHSSKRGFAPAASLLQARIRKAAQSRGFAVMRLVTHWPEVAGEEIAKMAQPVKVGHDRGGLGATLTLLTTGAHAPMVEMMAPRICEKVNACYGYKAIARVRVTQTAPTGFAEGQAAFVGKAHSPTPPPPDPALQAQAAATASPVADENLRAALEQLAAHVLTKAQNNRSPS